MKVYARQINPEHQESPLFYDSDSFPDNIAVFGNRDFGERMPDVVRRVREVLESGELETELEYIANKRTFYAAYSTATEAITAYLPPEHKERYSTREINRMKEAVEKYNRDEETGLCLALSIVTGQKWHCQQITGICQGDWNTLYYPEEWNPDNIGAFETEYFNAGSEWIIHDEEEAPETPEDVTGYSVYCTSWGDEAIRAELAAVAGCAPADVVMYRWTGSRSTDVYEEV